MEPRIRIKLLNESSLSGIEKILSGSDTDSDKLDFIERIILFNKSNIDSLKRKVALESYPSVETLTAAESVEDVDEGFLAREKARSVQEHEKSLTSKVALG